MKEVTLDNLGPDLEEATLQTWFFEEGDSVSEGDEIAELSTGDSVIVIQAPVSGLIAEVYFDEGESVAKGEVLCMIDEVDEDEMDADDDESDGDDDDDEEDDE